MRDSSVCAIWKSIRPKPRYTKVTYSERPNRRKMRVSSPEPMVQLLDGHVVSRPIAGTRRRGSNDEEDRLVTLTPPQSLVTFRL